MQCGGVQHPYFVAPHFKPLINSYKLLFEDQLVTGDDFSIDDLKFTI